MSLYVSTEDASLCHLSEANDLSRWAIEMLRCAQHDSAVTCAGSPVVTLSEARGLSRWAERCFTALSMTVLSRVLVPRLSS